MTRTGLPSAVDGARDADGTLLRWKKMGGNEMGKDVVRVLGMDELSGGGPAAEDGALDDAEEGEGSWGERTVGPGGGESSACSPRRHEEDGSALAASAASAGSAASTSA